MSQAFNLIATCERNREFEAVLELERLLDEIGDKEARAWESDVKGLIFGWTTMDPFDVVKKLRDLAKEKPWEFRVLKRLIPIEFNVRTSLEEIRKICEELSKRIDPSETFRITLEKRHTSLSSKEIIQTAARPINSPVDLKNPKKIVLIEIVGRITGISLLSSERDILNVTKEILNP
ncbi:RNA methyltransferase [Candidatus Geothermarchaeota archaeon]|mgnify:CR=1 FL=1|nr:MAG: RNA methyltransferase [Candidatus Geothermarchaeota archaeon]